MSTQRNQRKRVERVMRIVMRLIITYFLATICYGVHAQDSPPVPIQPFALHVRQVEDALEYLGQPLSRDDQKAINDAMGQADETKAVAQIERVLDKYVLCIVDITPETPVKDATEPTHPPH